MVRAERGAGEGVAHGCEPGGRPLSGQPGCSAQPPAQETPALLAWECQPLSVTEAEGPGAGQHPPPVPQLLSWSHPRAPSPGH